MKLNPKRQRFVQEYLVDLNATQAAIRAGYSPGSARLQGHRMITNDNIRECIQAAMDRRSERTGINADHILREMALIGFANIGDFLGADEYGYPRFEVSDLTREQTAAIREIKIDTRGPGRCIQLKMSDKLTALLAMGRHLELQAPAVEYERLAHDAPDDRS